MDEWGQRKIDGLLEDGTTVIVVSGFILKEVTDSLSLSDAVLRDEILTVSDSVGLADVPLKDWTPQITDAVALSDLILRDKAFSIHDSISLRGTVTPSIVGTSSVFTAISRPFQRKIFFANGLFWVFYSDGTNMVYRTSADG